MIIITLLIQSRLLAVISPIQSEDRLIDTIPDGVEVFGISFGETGKVAAYGAKEGEQFRVVAGNWKSKWYRFAGLPVVCRDGRVIFYAKEDRRDLVVQNDQVLFELPNDWSWLVPGAVSATGEVVASLGRDSKSKREAFSLNGRIVTEHRGVACGLVMSEDGKTVAFRLDKNDEESCIVVNGKEGASFESVTVPALSLDGRVLAYGAYDGKEYLIIFGDKKTNLKHEVAGVFLSIDGSKLGYWIVQREGGQPPMRRVIIGTREGPAFPHRLNQYVPRFSKDGKQVAYRATDEAGRDYIVVDEKKYEAVGIEGDPFFIEQGPKIEIGYGVRRGRELRWRVIQTDSK